VVPKTTSFPRDGSFVCTGRILHLTQDVTLIQRQLDGVDLLGPIGAPLLDDLSTDAITPVETMYDFDERLGDWVYSGIRGDAGPVVAPGKVRAGGFEVSVSGRRRGKGSSREHAPWAERCAGIRLIIAESFEHIYRRNCQNLGILTSTDFEILERLQRGEAIGLADLLRDLDPLAAEVLRHGSLFDFSRARLEGRVVAPSLRPGTRPMTLGEKILARHAVVDGTRRRVGVPAVAPGDVTFVEADLRVSHEYITPMAAALFRKHLGPQARVLDPASVLLFRDHLTFLDDAIAAQARPGHQLAAARELERIQAAFAEEHGIRLVGEQADRKGSWAISHNRLLEQHAMPGQLILSADSHAPHVGAIGCLALGVGATALANSWVSKDVHVAVPKSIRIDLLGACPPGVSAKDVVLHLLRDPAVRAGNLAGRLVEWAGDGVGCLAIDERATLTNMAAELGAFSSVIAPDAVAAAYLAARGIPVEEAERLCSLQADADARYERVLRVQLQDLRPMLALPGDPGSGQFVDELEGPVEIDIAFGGSCTASKATDMDMYAEVLRRALEEGRGVHRRVTFTIQLGSTAVREHCRDRGHLEVFRLAGARVLEPGCGACCNAGPGVSVRAEQITISAANRNYTGRSGPGKVYLGSPYTVAASAVAGSLVPYRPAAPIGRQEA
jgi:3-isopropylmalate/(R)-2-methylmalate dehydratase large subunit